MHRAPKFRPHEIAAKNRINLLQCRKAVRIQAKNKFACGNTTSEDPARQSWVFVYLAFMISISPPLRKVLNIAAVKSRATMPWAGVSLPQWHSVGSANEQLSGLQTLSVLKNANKMGFGWRYCMIKIQANLHRSQKLRLFLTTMLGL